MATSTPIVNKVRVLITGSNGLLGQKLVYLFRERNIEFLATSKGANRLPMSDVPYESLDVTDGQMVMSCLRDYKPTTVIHGAAMTQVDQCEKDQDRCWQVNTEAVSHLIKACEEFNTHLIYISTDFIFDGKAGPYDEEATPNPVNYYGKSKLAAEKLVIESNISWAILRTVLVYGATPGISRSNIMIWVRDSLKAGKVIQVVDDQFRTPTLAEDLAMGCLLATEKQARGIFNISGKDLLTPYDIAQLTAEYFSLDKKLIKRTDSKKFTQPASRPLKTGFVIKKARNELGYQPHSFEEGLAITAAQWE